MFVDIKHCSLMIDSGPGQPHLYLCLIPLYLDIKINKIQACYSLEVIILFATLFLAAFLILSISVVTLHFIFIFTVLLAFPFLFLSSFFFWSLNFPFLWRYKYQWFWAGSLLCFQKLWAKFLSGGCMSSYGGSHDFRWEGSFCQ